LTHISVFDIVYFSLNFRLKMKRRIENADRARREQEYRNKVAVKKLEMQWGRMNKMKEIEEAIRRQRDLKKKKEIIARHKWIADTKLERAITPGPGEYNETGSMATAKANCAKWGQYNPKSEIEWIMYRAKQLPAPGDVSLLFDDCGFCCFCCYCIGCIGCSSRHTCGSLFFLPPHP
jgi:hypothetical protein